MTQSNLNYPVDVNKNTHLSAADIDIDARKQIRNMNDEYLLTAQELDELKIIYPGCQDDKSLNDYRELRTKILKAANNENFVCMISSLTPQAGTSHIAMNLAASIALDHSKTALVIDCNSYTSCLDNYLNHPPKFGLSHFLEGDTEKIEDIIYSSGIPRLRIIPSGIRTQHAAENFSSEKMEHFISMVKIRYPDRFIILDTPPIGRYAESQILASICDMTILVVRYGKTTPSQVQVGIDLIGNGKLAGIILNDK
ncbi:AAA family ATPase [Psychromonas antarctica]|uniref:AAA family ATPase n=1 Tax=Psychromonas antarctica TaxID=67573 RepID=UPI001EE87CB2|nr:AAA family ATPase [Psychromonas antarctica]MCG6200936.1 AAA family ATPase [Psychromonas antarctica]